MSINSILSSGLQSMQAGINRASAAGSSLNVGSSDFAAKMVAMQQGGNEAKVAANVIKTGDEILGALISLRS